MRLVIFGAGASAGSAASDTPPVTAKLLPALQASYPSSWGKLKVGMILEGRGDFELIMSHVIDTDTTSTTWELQQDLARYFLNFEPTTESLYTRFASEIVHPDLAICTLNYDLLLQRAMQMAGRSSWISGFEEQNPNANMMILPHGSAGLCDKFGNISDINMIGLSPFNGIVSPRTDARLHLKTEECEAAFARNQLNPIMSYVEPQKRSIMGSENLSNARAKLKEACKSSDRIAIVGMRYQQHDRHIVDALRSIQGELMVCCGNGGDDYTKNLKAKVIDLKQHWDAGFEKIKCFLLE